MHTAHSIHNTATNMRSVENSFVDYKHTCTLRVGCHKVTTIQYCTVARQPSTTQCTPNNTVVSQHLSLQQLRQPHCQATQYAPCSPHAALVPHHTDPQCSNNKIRALNTPAHETSVCVYDMNLDTNWPYTAHTPTHTMLTVHTQHTPSQAAWQVRSGTPDL